MTAGAERRAPGSGVLRRGLEEVGLPCGWESQGPQEEPGSAWITSSHFQLRARPVARSPGFVQLAPGRGEEIGILLHGEMRVPGALVTHPCCCVWLRSSSWSQLHRHGHQAQGAAGLT